MPAHSSPYDYKRPINKPWNRSIGATNDCPSSSGASMETMKSTRPLTAIGRSRPSPSSNHPSSSHPSSIIHHPPSTSSPSTATGTRRPITAPLHHSKGSHQSRPQSSSRPGGLESPGLDAHPPPHSLEYAYPSSTYAAQSLIENTAQSLHRNQGNLQHPNIDDGNSNIPILHSTIDAQHVSVVKWLSSTTALQPLASRISRGSAIEACAIINLNNHLICDLFLTESTPHSVDAALYYIQSCLNRYTIPELQNGFIIVDTIAHMYHSSSTSSTASMKSSSTSSTANLSSSIFIAEVVKRGLQSLVFAALMHPATPTNYFNSFLNEFKYISTTTAYTQVSFRELASKDTASRPSPSPSLAHLLDSRNHALTLPFVSALIKKYTFQFKNDDDRDGMTTVVRQAKINALQEWSQQQNNANNAKESSVSDVIGGTGIPNIRVSLLDDDVKEHPSSTSNHPSSITNHPSSSDSLSIYDQPLFDQLIETRNILLSELVQRREASINSPESINSPSNHDDVKESALDVKALSHQSPPVNLVSPPCVDVLRDIALTVGELGGWIPLSTSSSTAPPSLYSQLFNSDIYSLWSDPTTDPSIPPSTVHSAAIKEIIRLKLETEKATLTRHQLATFSVKKIQEVYDVLNHNINTNYENIHSDIIKYINEHRFDNENVDDITSLIVTGVKAWITNQSSPSTPPITDLQHLIKSILQDATRHHSPSVTDEIMHIMSSHNLNLVSALRKTREDIERYKKQFFVNELSELRDLLSYSASLDISNPATASPSPSPQSLSAGPQGGRGIGWEPPTSNCVASAVEITKLKDHDHYKLLLTQELDHQEHLHQLNKKNEIDMILQQQEAYYKSIIGTMETDHDLDRNNLLQQLNALMQKLEDEERKTVEIIDVERRNGLRDVEDVKALIHGQETFYHRIINNIYNENTQLMNTMNEYLNVLTMESGELLNEINGMSNNLNEMITSLSLLSPPRSSTIKESDPHSSPLSSHSSLNSSVTTLVSIIHPSAVVSTNALSQSASRLAHLSNSIGNFLLNFCNNQNKNIETLSNNTSNELKENEKIDAEWSSLPHWDPSVIPQSTPLESPDSESQIDTLLQSYLLRLIDEETKRQLSLSLHQVIETMHTKQQLDSMIADAVASAIEDLNIKHASDKNELVTRIVKEKDDEYNKIIQKRMEELMISSEEEATQRMNDVIEYYTNKNTQVVNEYTDVITRMSQKHEEEMRGLIARRDSEISQAMRRATELNSLENDNQLNNLKSYYESLLVTKITSLMSGHEEALTAQRQQHTSDIAELQQDIQQLKKNFATENQNLSVQLSEQITKYNDLESVFQEYKASSILAMNESKRNIVQQTKFLSDQLLQDTINSLNTEWSQKLSDVKQEVESATRVGTDALVRQECLLAKEAALTQQATDLSKKHDDHINFKMEELMKQYENQLNYQKEILCLEYEERIKNEVESAIRNTTNSLEESYNVILKNKINDLEIQNKIDNEKQIEKCVDDAVLQAVSVVKRDMNELLARLEDEQSAKEAALESSYMCKLQEKEQEYNNNVHKLKVKLQLKYDEEKNDMKEALTYELTQGKQREMQQLLEQCMIQQEEAIQVAIDEAVDSQKQRSANEYHLLLQSEKSKLNSEHMNAIMELKLSLSKEKDAMISDILAVHEKKLSAQKNELSIYYDTLVKNLTAQNTMSLEVLHQKYKAQHAVEVEMWDSKIKASEMAKQQLYDTLEKTKEDMKDNIKKIRSLAFKESKNILINEINVLFQGVLHDIAIEQEVVTSAAIQEGMHRILQSAIHVAEAAKYEAIGLPIYETRAASMPRDDHPSSGIDPHLQQVLCQSLHSALRPMSAESMSSLSPSSRPLSQSTHPSDTVVRPSTTTTTTLPTNATYLSLLRSLAALNQHVEQSLPLITDADEQELRSIVQQRLDQGQHGDFEIGKECVGIIKKYYNNIYKNSNTTNTNYPSDSTSTENPPVNVALINADNYVHVKEVERIVDTCISATRNHERQLLLEKNFAESQSICMTAVKHCRYMIENYYKQLCALILKNNKTNDSNDIQSLWETYEKIYTCNNSNRIENEVLVVSSIKKWILYHNLMNNNTSSSKIALVITAVCEAVSGASIGHKLEEGVRTALEWSKHVAESESLVVIEQAIVNAMCRREEIRRDGDVIENKDDIDEHTNPSIPSNDPMSLDEVNNDNLKKSIEYATILTERMLVDLNTKLAVLEASDDLETALEGLLTSAVSASA